MARFRSVFLIAAALIGTKAGWAQDSWGRPEGRVQVEFGLDSLERKFYKPEFSLSWPVVFAVPSRVFFDLNYLQRINGDLEGPVDFWVQTGLEARLSNSISIEASLNHFCRHQTSLFNSHILNLNELIGRVWLQNGGIRLGLGFGTYVGGSPGYNGLMLINLTVPHLLLPELSFESEVKWVNLSEILHETGFSIALSSGTDLFITQAKHYHLGRTTHLGLRFRPEGPNARLLDGFDMGVGAYPFFDDYKMMVNGGFRLAFLREPSRRFFLDINFRSPILSGSEFWGPFWPDRMLYTVSAEYERAIGGLFAAWYGRYFVDMPSDKAVPFRAGSATGLSLRNQSDFDRLDKSFRFEIRAGFDFKFVYDFGLKVGLQTKGKTGGKAGGELRIEANKERRTAEALAFFDFGLDVSIRPFVGVRRVTTLAGEPAPDDPFKRTLIVGIAFHKWF